MKAVGLLSGGLDSPLAVKIILEIGIEVVALKFTSPFCQCDSGGCSHAAAYSRAETDEVLVRCNAGGATRELLVQRQTREAFKPYYV